MNTLTHTQSICAILLLSEIQTERAGFPAGSIPLLTLRCSRCGRVYQADEARIGSSILCLTSGCDALVPVQRYGELLSVKPLRLLRSIRAAFAPQYLAWAFVISVFGAFAVAVYLLYPTFPPITARQARLSALPKNGTVLLTVNGNVGKGELAIDNGTMHGAVVELAFDTGEEQGKVYRSVFVSRGQEWTMKQIATGQYRILFVQGDTWDAAQKKFADPGAYKQFEQPLGLSDTPSGYTVARITLYTTPEGTARVQDSNEDAFNGTR